MPAGTCHCKLQTRESSRFLTRRIVLYHGRKLGTGKVMAGCPAYVAEFFTRLVPLVRPMAKRLAIDEDYLLTLSVHEHGWADPHNDQLHNLFGTTHGGGNNLSYGSDEEAAQSWEAHYGGGVRGSTSINDFVSKIRAMGYNTKDTDYDMVMISTYQSLVRRKADCGMK